MAFKLKHLLGLEYLSADLATSVKSMILNQVENGITIRMSILYTLLGGKKGENSD